MQLHRHKNISLRNKVCKLLIPGYVNYRTNQTVAPSVCPVGKLRRCRWQSLIHQTGDTICHRPERIALLKRITPFDVFPDQNCLTTLFIKSQKINLWRKQINWEYFWCRLCSREIDVAQSRMDERLFEDADLLLWHTIRTVWCNIMYKWFASITLWSL